MKKKRYVDLINSATDFLARDIPPRTWLLDKTIPHPSLGMLFAYRGNGKTFTALDLAVHVANGERWMAYDIPEARAVLYIDGEMPIADLHERLTALCNAHPPKNLYVLASEDLAVAHESLNLAVEKDRDAMAEAVLHLVKHVVCDDFGLIIFDNWSHLIRGIDENDNTKLDPLKQWFIKLRHGEQSVLLVHHEGKARTGQRGASAREDMVDYSIKLTELFEEKPASRFRFEWDKVRGVKPDPMDFEMLLSEVDGQLGLRLADPSGNRNAEIKSKYDDKIRPLLPGTFTDIKEKSGLHDQTVNRILNRIAYRGPNGDWLLND